MPLIDQLAALYPGASRTRLREWIRAGRVRVNGQRARRADVPVAPHDRVTLGPPAPPPFPAPLRCVHEDDDLIVVDKPAGLLTIADARERTRTAYRLLARYVERRGRGRLFVVHRLDRETSGLVVFAKSGAGKRALQEQFAARDVERVYVAVVEGRVARDAGTIELHLAEGRDLRVRPTRDPHRGRDAITRFRVLERRRASTVLELSLETGRRGQIRASLAALGYPIVGDRQYGAGADPVGRLCLHAVRLGFRHPRGMRVVFTSEVPTVFARV